MTVKIVLILIDTFEDIEVDVLGGVVREVGL